MQPLGVNEAGDKLRQPTPSPDDHENAFASHEEEIGSMSASSATRLLVSLLTGGASKSSGTQ